MRTRTVRITYKSLLARARKNPEFASYDLDNFALLFEVARVSANAGRRGYRFTASAFTGCVENENLDCTLRFTRKESREWL